MQFEGVEVHAAEEQGDEHAIVVAAGQGVVEGGHGDCRIGACGPQLLEEADRPGHEQGCRNALVRHVAYRDIQQPVAAVVAVEVAPHRAGGQHPGPEAVAFALLAGLAAMGQHRHLYFPGGIQLAFQPAAPGGGGLQVGDIGLEVTLHGGEGVDQSRHLIVAPGRRQRRFQVAAGHAVARLRQGSERPGKPARHQGHGGGQQQQGE